MVAFVVDTISNEFSAHTESKTHMAENFEVQHAITSLVPYENSVIDAVQEIEVFGEKVKCVVGHVNNTSKVFSIILKLLLKIERK